MKKEFLVNPDFQEFIKVLNKHKVDYCITGAFAVSFHAEPRYTYDIDFYIAKQLDNAKKVSEALREFTGSNEIDDELFKGDKVIFRMGFQPNQIELSNHLSGITDDEIMKHRVKSKYGDADAYYIGINELIKNKGVVKDMPIRGTKGAQDARDYYMLEKIKTRK